MPYAVLGDLQTLTLGEGVTCDNPCCILTLNNIVMIMGNMVLENYAQGSPILTLPESMTPTSKCVLPCYVDMPNATMTAVTKASLGITIGYYPYELIPVTLETSGVLTAPIDATSATLFTNGMTFNANDRYYNSDIGNNFPQGTSPLNWGALV